MKHIGIVLGVVAVATLAGCKNPDYVSDRKSAQNAVKTVPAAQKAKKPAPVVVVKKTCSCAPGTKHSSPCTCGASDCRCVVVAPAPKPTVVPAAPAYTTYIVQNGDYLAKISKRYNVTIASILKLNPSIKKNVIFVGQKLKLPGKVDVGVQRTPAARPAARKKASKPYAPYSGSTKEYVVKTGDSLGAIAYGNGITVRQLKELNALKSDRINVGQKLKIPAGKAKAAVVTKTPPVEQKKEAPVKPEAKTEPVAQPEVGAAPDAVKSEQADTKEVPPAGDAVPEVGAEAKDGGEKTSSSAAANETYVVQEGDDMTGVSIRWGVSAAAIRELNNLGDNDQLKPGQIIKLPAEAQQ